jgi:hypothetical protein
MPTTPAALRAAFKAAVAAASYLSRLQRVGAGSRCVYVPRDAEDFPGPSFERVSLEWTDLNGEVAALRRQLQTALSPVRPVLTRHGSVSFGGMTRLSAHGVVEALLEDFEAGIEQARRAAIEQARRTADPAPQMVTIHRDEHGGRTARLVREPSPAEIEAARVAVADYARMFGRGWRWKDLFAMLRDEHDQAAR